MNFGQLDLENDDLFPEQEYINRTESNVREDKQLLQREILLEMQAIRTHPNHSYFLSLLDKHVEEKSDIRDLLDVYNVQLGLMEEEMKEVEQESVHLYLKIENRKKILKVLEELTFMMEIDSKYLYILNEGKFLEDNSATPSSLPINGGTSSTQKETNGGPGNSLDVISAETLPLMVKALNKLSKSLHKLQHKHSGMTELADLFAVKERMAMFKAASINFSQKFSQAMKEIILEQSTAMVNERGRYSRKGFLVLLDHGSIYTSLGKFQKVAEALAHLESTNGKTIASIANYYEEQMEKIYEKEFKAFMSVFLDNYLLIRRKSDEDLLLSSPSVGPSLISVEEGKSNFAKKYGSRTSVSNKSLKRNSICEDYETAEDYKGKICPESDREPPKESTERAIELLSDDTMVSAIAKMQLATESLQNFSSFSADEKLYPDVAIDYILQNKLPIILKEFHFFQSLFGIPIGHNTTSLDNPVKRNMARMFDAFFKGLDNCIRVTLAKIYQTQFTAVEIILILEKNFFITKRDGKVSTDLQKKDSHDYQVKGTEPKGNDPLRKSSAESSKSLTDKDPLDSERKNSTESYRKVFNDSTVDHPTSSSTVDQGSSSTDYSDMDNNNAPSNIQILSKSEEEPFDFMEDYIKGWKLFLSSKFRQFIDSQIAFIINYRRGWVKKRPTHLLLPIKKYPGFISTLHLIEQHCTFQEGCLASVLIHESVAKIYQEILSMLREIQDEIQKDLPNDEVMASKISKDFTVLSSADYLLQEEKQDKSMMLLETQSLKSTSSLKSSTKSKIASFGFFGRRLDSTLPLPVSEEIPSASIPLESRTYMLLENLVLLIENYHYLSVRLGGTTFGTFFSPNAIMLLRNQYEIFLDAFCNVNLKLSFPKLCILLHLVKSKDLDKAILLKNLQLSGTLKDHKKTLLLIAKKTLKLLSKELGLFPIVWHHFELTFTNFFIKDLWPSLEALQDNKLNFTFSKDDIKNIFNDVPLQL